MSSRLFVGGLALEVTEKELFDLFGQVASVDQVSIIKDRATDASRGFAFVEMRSAEGAKAAMDKLHGLELHGRALKVAEAKPSKKWAETKTASPAFEAQRPVVEAIEPVDDAGPKPRVREIVSPPPALRETVMSLPAVPEAVSSSPKAPRPMAPEPMEPEPTMPRARMRSLATTQPLNRQRALRSRRWFRRRLTMRLAVVAVVMLAASGFFALWWQPPSLPLDPQAVLVMPVEVLGQSEAGEYLSYAFAQSLAVNLATVKDLRVLPVPQASEAVLAEHASQVARQRGAGRLVSATLTTAAGQTQISITLVDTREDRILWGKQHLGKKDEILAIAADLAVEIAERLGAAVPVLVPPVTDLTGGPPMATSALTAAALGAIRRVEVDAALAATEKLVAAFPQEPAALVLRVHAHLLRWDAERSRENHEALQAALRDLDIKGGGAPYTNFYRAYILYNEGRDREALAGFTHILDTGDLSPAGRSWVLRYRAFGRQRLSDTAGAMADLQESLRLDPANPWTLNILSGVLLEAGQAEQAMVRAKQALALLPSNWRNHQVLGEALNALGRRPEAAASFGRACQLSQTQSSCSGHGLLLWKTGETERAVEVIERSRQFPDTIYGAYNLACFYAITGDPPEAQRLLQKAVELGLADKIISTDEDLESLRGDEGFELLVRIVEGRVTGNCSGQRCPEP